MAMPRNVAQILAANPVTVIGNTDILYVVQSGTTDAAITGANLKALFQAPLTTTTTALQVLQGTAVAGVTAWSTATYPATVAVNSLLYASGANVVAALAPVNGSVLTNTSSGVPAYVALTTGKFVVGTGTSPGASAYTMPATLTANGVFYASATGVVSQITLPIAPAILACNASSAPGWSTLSNAGDFVQSNGTIVGSSSYTLPTGTLTANGLLFASTALAVTQLASANNGVLATNGTGVPAIATTLPANLTIPTPAITGRIGGAYAGTGNVGNIIHLTAVITAQTLVSNSPTDILSRSLPAGNYLIWGNTAINSSGGSGVNINQSWINSASATMPVSQSVQGSNMSGFYFFNGIAVAPVAFSLTTTTTVYLSTEATFSTGTTTAGGDLYIMQLP